MSRPILKSNSAFFATGPSPAWKTGEESGYFMPLVQNSEISISIDRQTSKRIGSQQYAIDDIMRSPDVNLNMTYLYSPFMINEYLMGMYKESGLVNSFASEQLNRDQNFYLIIDNKEGDEILPQFSKVPQRTNFSGMSCVSIGNCFLSNYSLDFKVGSIPSASMSFVGSNLKMDNLTGSRIGIPAINLQSGNNSGSGFLDFNNLKTSLSGFVNTDYPSKPNVYAIPVAAPHTVEATLQNLQVGGVPLVSGALIQSLNISMPFERTDLFGLGSNYVYGRKLQLPIRASVDVSVIVQNMNSGDISQLHRAEQSYDFSIAIADVYGGFAAESYLNFHKAKLESFSYSMDINATMQFSAKYSVEITDTTGFQAISAMRWIAETGIWSNINFLWSTW
jgi:hypothetical protein